MNRMLKIAFGAVLGTALMGGAVAQNFPDVPEYHWAYEALLNMKNEGILVGYPDGLYRPGRPANRAELAAAVNSAYEKLKGMINGLQNQVDTLNRKIGDVESGLANKADKSELAALRDALNALRAEVETIKGWRRIIDDLQRLVNEFQAELREIRGDVDGMKSDLVDIKRRLDALEKRKPAVDIHGDVNLIMLAGHSTDDLFGITVDGRPTGFGRGDYSGLPVGMTRDLTIGHEAAFRFSGTNDTGPQWHATLVVGNLLGYNFGEGGSFGTIFGNQSGVQFGVPFAESSTKVYFQDFAVNLGTSLFGQGIDLTLGRVGYQTSGWFFARQDNTPYFHNERWDDGNWYFDGAIIGFNWGTVGLDVFAGRQSGRLDSDGFGSILATEVWPMMVGPMPSVVGPLLMVDQHLGANLTFGLGDRGDVMLNYIMLDSNWTSGGINRMTVFGGEVNFNITDNIAINGGYSQTNYQYNTSNVLDEDNFAWWANVSFNFGRANIHAGYRHVEPFFGAPGDWGRTAFLWNPTDLKGFHGGVSFDVNDRFNLAVDGYFYEAVDGAIFVSDLEVLGIKGELNYQISDTWGLMLGGEYVKWDTTIGGTNPKVFWGRVGLNWAMDSNSQLKFFYELSDLDIDAGFGFGISSDRKGGLFTAQWSRKY